MLYLRILTFTTLILLIVSIFIQSNHQLCKIGTETREISGDCRIKGAMLHSLFAVRCKQENIYIIGKLTPGEKYATITGFMLNMNDLQVLRNLNNTDYIN